MNEPQILKRQDKLCICFILDLKRPLKEIVSIPFFITDLSFDASILGFIKS